MTNTLDNHSPDRVFRAISNPITLPLISASKFLNSKEFQPYTIYAESQYLNHRNVTPYLILIKIFDKSKYLELISNWLKLKHDFFIIRNNRELIINPPKLTISRDIKLKTILSSSEEIRGATIKKNEKINKINNFEKIDALDHPARLPGSFGTGKR